MPRLPFRKDSNRSSERPRRRGIRLAIERLECRRLLTATGVAPLPELPMDVNQDGKVSVADASYILRAIATADSSPQWDVNGDSAVTAADALQVINYLYAETILNESGPGSAPEFEADPALVSFPETIRQRDTGSLVIDALPDALTSSLESIEVDWGDGKVERFPVTSTTLPLSIPKTYFVVPSVVNIEVSGIASGGGRIAVSSLSTTVTASSPQVSDRTNEGFIAEIFDNPTLAGEPVVTRVDPTIAFDFGLDRLDAKLPPGDQVFSARWSGMYTPTTTALHQFLVRTGANDRVRILVNGELLISTFDAPTSAQRNASRSLVANEPVSIVVEYVAGLGYSRLELRGHTNQTFRTFLESELLRPSTPFQPSRSGMIAERFDAPSNVEIWTVDALRASQSFIANTPVRAIDVASSVLSTSELSSTGDGASGIRVRGWLTAPVSGAYRFYLAASDEAELWLGHGQSSANLQRIATVVSPTLEARFGDANVGRSIDVALVAGQPYYIEAILAHDVVGQGPHLAIGWNRPDQMGLAPTSLAVESLRPIAPTVRIIAEQSKTSEFLAASAPIVARVIRGDDIGRDLEVGYTVGGTARNGIDYVRLSGTVTIPAGARSAPIVINPIADNLTEIAETITLRLATSDRYQLDVESTRQVIGTIMGESVNGRQILGNDSLRLENLSSVSATEPNAVAEFCTEVAGLPFSSRSCTSATSVPNAVRVEVNQFTNPWDVNLTHVIPAEGLTSGKQLFVVVWARSANVDGSDAQVGLRLQELTSYAGNERIFDVGQEWTPLYWTVEPNFAGDTTSPRSIDIRLGYKNQTVELGGWNVVELSASTRIGDVPRTIRSYEGRLYEDDWRDQAAIDADTARTRSLSLRVEDSLGRLIPGAAVTVTPLQPALPIGMAVSPARFVLSSDPYTQTPESRRYQEIVKRYFPIVTDAGASQWGPWETNPQLPTAFLDWAVAAGREYHGHSLAWGEMDDFPAPADLRAMYESFPPELGAEWLRERLLEHVRSGPAAEFAGERGDTGVPKVTAWDVLNHPVLVPELWEITGSDFMLEILEMARSVVHPDTVLLVNETGPLEDPSSMESTRLFELLQRLDSLSPGGRAPFDEIGFQSHFDSFNLPSIDTLDEVFERYSVLGRPFQVTEYDLDAINIDRQTQADFTRDFFQLLASRDDVTKATHWGFWEGNHWRSSEDAAPFNRDWTPTPVGQVLLEQLSLSRFTQSFATRESDLNVAIASSEAMVRVEYQGRVIERRVELDDQRELVVRFDDLEVGAIDASFGVPLQDRSFGAGGEAFILYRADGVQEAFPSLPANASRNLVPVRWIDGNWFYDNDVEYLAFTPQSGDRLVASINLRTRVVTMLQGLNTTYEGIRLGYESSDVVITPNRWGGRANPGEYEVMGTSIAFSAEEAEAQWLGNVGLGVLAREDAASRSGEAFLLYSSEAVTSRVQGHNPNAANHLIIVRWIDGEWVYDNDRTYLPWTSVPSDRLIAHIDLRTRAVSMLQGMNLEFQGIGLGYESSDLVVTPNRWNNITNFGEFGVRGTVIQWASDAPSGEWLGFPGFGVLAQEAAVTRSGEGFLMYSAEAVQSRFASFNVNAARHLVFVRLIEDEWVYDNDRAYVPFLPLSSDRLVARVDLRTRAVTLLQGEQPSVNGIASGFLESDLSVTPNVWNGLTNFGEFGVAGTMIRFE